jgi:hypothetical protein
MLLHEVINEIKGLRHNASSRSVHDIYNLLVNNRVRFESKIDAHDFNGLLGTFKTLTDRRPAEYNEPRFRDEFKRAVDLLLFYLDKII